MKGPGKEKYHSSTPIPPSQGIPYQPAPSAPMYGPPPQTAPIYASTPPGVQTTAQVYGTAPAPLRVPYSETAFPPQAPPGYCYILQEDFSMCGILWAACCFPLGLICLFGMRDKYWRLMPGLAIGATGYGITGF